MENQLNFALIDELAKLKEENNKLIKENGELKHKLKLEQDYMKTFIQFHEFEIKKIKCYVGSLYDNFVYFDFNKSRYPTKYDEIDLTTRCCNDCT